MEVQKKIVLNNKSQGKTINICGLNIVLPKKPKASEILFNNKGKEKQKWERTEIPPGLDEDSFESYKDFIKCYQSKNIKAILPL